MESTNRCLTRRIVLFVLLLTASSITVDAQVANVDILQDYISPYETLQVRITTDSPVTPPLSQDILVTDGQNKKVSASPSIIPINETLFFITLNIPEIEDGTYTLSIKNIRFILQGQLFNIQSTKEIQILTTKPQIDFNPAVITAKPGDVFTISAKSQQSIILNINAPPVIKHLYSQPQSLGTQSKRTFTFTIDQFYAGQHEIEILFTDNNKVWSIPLFLEPSEETPVVNEEKDIPILLLAPSTKISKKLYPGEEIKGSIPLQNNLNETLSQVSLSLQGSVADFIVIPNPLFENIQPLQKFDPMLIINPTEEITPGLYTGSLFVESQNYKLPITIEITIEEKTEAPEIPEEPFPESDLPEIEDDGSIFEEPDEMPLIDFNTTTSKTPERREVIVGPFIIVMILLIIAIIIYIFSKKHPEQKSLSEYVEEIERKRR